MIPFGAPTRPSHFSKLLNPDTKKKFTATYLSTTMATIQLIKEAVMAIKDRSGSSVIAINKWIESEKKVSPIIKGMSDH
jgi:hypothetical protein